MKSLCKGIILTGICYLFVSSVALPASRGINPAVVHPLEAFANMPQSAGTWIVHRGDCSFPDSGHWQGIQTRFYEELKQQICFLSRDSRTHAYFVAAVLDPASLRQGTMRHVQILPSDGQQPPLRHAGGIQLTGDCLVVGVEDNQDKLRSQIQFWDVSNPFAPRLRAPLTIKRQSTIPKDMTAGAVGMVKLKKLHVLVVANWDTRDLDFYRSNGLPLADDACRFSLVLRWSCQAAHRHAWQPDRDWESYQAVNLVSDFDANIYLLGLTTTATGKDVIDLFSVDLDRDVPNVVQKIGRRQPTLQDNANFRAAGGIYIESATELGYCASESKGRDTIVVNMSE